MQGECEGKSNECEQLRLALGKKDAECAALRRTLLQRDALICSLSVAPNTPSLDLIP